jgi:cold shock CspA family protein
MANNTDATSSISNERLNGRVKWFNNKAGYGFITVTDGSQSGSDIFIHHSAISVADQQYKYLVQGEYVSFNMAHTSSEKHAWQASSVSGINNGKLMCETRNEYRNTRSAYHTEKPVDGDVKMPRQQSAPRRPDSRGPPANGQRVARTRGEGPREGSGSSGDWKLADKPVDSKPKRIPRPPRSDSIIEPK